MKPELNQDSLQCPSCEGNKTVRWASGHFPCTLCNGDGHIELKKQEPILKNPNHPSHKSISKGS